MDSKTCPRCKAAKAFDQFSKNKKALDGLQTQCKACNAEVTKAYRQTEQGRAKKLEIQRRYLATENGREVTRESMRRYRREQPGKEVHRVQLRNLLRQSRVPGWACLDAIEDVYIEAEQATMRTGIKHHVDHIVPLRSKLVSGLHWHGNLQVITQAENLAKGNKFWPDMPD